MKDDMESRAPFLEQKPGLNGVNYAQKFVKAPLSEHPSKAPSSGKDMPDHTHVMSVTMGRRG